MSAGIVTAILPTVVSGGTFAGRRIEKACQANDATQTTMNSVVATGQIERAAECSAKIAQNTEGELAKVTISAKEQIEKAAIPEGKKVGSFAQRFSNTFSRFKKFAQFVGDNVNKFIVLTSVFKVANSDDKLRDGIIETSAVTGMLAVTEPAYKRIAGMSTYKRKAGELIVNEHEGLYKKYIPYADKAAEAINDYCKTKKVFGVALEHAPKCAKGLGLVASSMFGYYSFGKLAKYGCDNLLPVQQEV